MFPFTNQSSKSGGIRTVQSGVWQNKNTLKFNRSTNNNNAARRHQQEDCYEMGHHNSMPSGMSERRGNFFDKEVRHLISTRIQMNSLNMQNKICRMQIAPITGTSIMALLPMMATEATIMARGATLCLFRIMLNMMNTTKVCVVPVCFYSQVFMQ